MISGDTGCAGGGVAAAGPGRNKTSSVNFGFYIPSLMYMWGRTWSQWHSHQIHLTRSCTSSGSPTGMQHGGSSGYTTNQQLVTLWKREPGHSL